MKKISVIICAGIILASCTRKDNSLQTDKNIVVMTDTSRASGSYLTDTGTAKLPVAVTSAPVRTAPVVRTPATTQHTSTTSNGTATTTTTTNAPVATTTTTRKKGWSSAAKDAAIGGVGGAVVGAVIGKGKGAIIGGILGAGGGYVLGRSKDKKTGRAQ